MLTCRNPARRLLRVVAAAITGIISAAGCKGKEGGPVGPPANTVATVEISPTSGSLSAIGEALQLAATAKNTAGAIVGGKSLILNSSNATVATVDANGRVVATGSGDATSTAATDGKTAQITVAVRQSVRHVVLTTQPRNIAAGAPFALVLRVELRDAGAAVAAAAQDPVTLMLSGGTVGGSLTDTATVAASNGVATFTGASVTRVGTAHRVTATAAGNSSAASSAFDVGTGSLTQLVVFSGAPTGVQGNVVLVASIRIGRRAAYANDVPNGAVTLSLRFVPHTPALLLGTLTVNATTGVAAFTDLRIVRRDRAAQRANAAPSSTTSSRSTKATASRRSVVAPTSRPAGSTPGAGEGKARTRSRTGH